MDKFTVDLEKVLDEFEYNESREETILPVIINSQAGANQVLMKPSIYRRPAFEPIHLSDADFSAASIPPVNVNFQSSLRETFNSNHKDTVGCTIQKDPFVDNEIEGYDSCKDSFNGNSVHGSVVLHLKEDPASQNSFDGVSSEGTPDLLDSTSTLRPPYDNTTFDLNNSQQLPDITSVWKAIKRSPPDHPTFDLIESQSKEPAWIDTSDKPFEKQVNRKRIKDSFDEESPTVRDLQDGSRSCNNRSLVVSSGSSGGYMEEINFSRRPFDGVDCSSLLKEKSNLNVVEVPLPPVVQAKSVMNAPLLDLKLQPLTFNTDDISDSELEEYLEHITELSEEQPLLDDPKSPEEGSSSVSQPFSADDNTSHSNQVITESTDVDTTTIGSTDSSIDENIPTEDLGIVEETKSSGESALTNEVITSESISIAEESSEGIAAPADPEEEIVKPHVSFAEPQGPINVEPPRDDPIDSNSFEGDTASTTTENEVNENIENTDNLSEVMVVAAKEVHNIEVLTEPAEVPSSTGSCRPSTLSLNIGESTAESEEDPTPTNIEGPPASISEVQIGKVPPFWVPDTDTEVCMQCQLKFTVIRRRHHCRACGLVLCSKCCCLKAPLEYMEFQEARVCQPCFTVIYRVGEDQSFQGRQPNPNNPMEYCSTIPPLQQAASSMNQPPPSVLVPSGVLKREGRAKSDVPKQVIFSDGIRPGGDLTELDAPSESRILPKRIGRRFAAPAGPSRNSPVVVQRPLDLDTQSFIPSGSPELPPVIKHESAQLIFLEDVPVVTKTPVKYAINNNLFVHVKRVKLECCVNRECWSICSEGLAIVGQDEVALVLECLEDEPLPPQDVFHYINTLYLEGSKGSTVSEMSYTPAFSSNMLGSKDHGGFLYIRPTFQCTTNLLLPKQPYIIAILVHRWETPWARLFPLRLILRLGAEYRYYPCPLVSVRNRSPLYTDIGHTVMKILVDFRKYSYSLATVRGLLIHMEDRQTTILFPRNRYDQVVRALNNSNDSVLAFGANLSLFADSHLVCIQGSKDENNYHTQAINIHNKPRKVTGASFVVFNGALKTPGLSGKTSIVEDGLMVQLPSDNMTALRTALRDMKDFTISCGPNDEETVYLTWSADDTNFNVGVTSVIDGKAFDGVPSIRVHNGTDYGVNRIIRWTEVFILKSEEERKSRDPIDISRVSESVARATCLALVQNLESLVKEDIRCLAIRTTIHPDSVGYEAGANESPLPQNHMNWLDEELIPVLHQAAISAQDTLILELVFRIIDHP